MPQELSAEYIQQVLQGISVPPQPQIMVDLQMEQVMPSPDLRAIAKEMGRSASTLSREVARNATRYDGFYRPSKAQVYAIGRRRRCRRPPGSWPVSR